MSFLSLIVFRSVSLLQSEIDKLDKNISEGNSKLDLIGDIESLNKRLASHRTLYQDAQAAHNELQTILR